MDVSCGPRFRDLGTDHPRADRNRRLDSFKGRSLDLGYWLSKSAAALKPVASRFERFLERAKLKPRSAEVSDPLGRFFGFVFLCFSLPHSQYSESDELRPVG